MYSLLQADLLGTELETSTFSLASIRQGDVPHVLRAYSGFANQHMQMVHLCAQISSQYLSPYLLVEKFISIVFVSVPWQQTVSILDAISTPSLCPLVET